MPGRGMTPVAESVGGNGSHGSHKSGSLVARIGSDDKEWRTLPSALSMDSIEK